MSRKAPLTKKIQELQEEQEEHKLRSEKIDKLKSAYAKYELGELNNDQFQNVVIAEIGIKDTGNLSKILNSTQMDKKSFREILNNTDLIKHRKPEEKKNPFYNPINNKYKRKKQSPMSLESKYEENAHVKKSTMQFLNSQISTEDYKKELVKQGINPNIAQINKLIRAKEEGDQVSYSSLMTSIFTHRNDSAQPSIKRTFKGINFRNKEDPGKENQERLMMASKKNNNFLVYNSKRKITSDVNAFKSQKDVFDWDLNALMTYQKEKNNPKRMSYGKQMTQKQLYSSNLFEGGEEKRPTIKRKYMGSSDIFHLKAGETNNLRVGIKNNKNVESNTLNMPTAKPSRRIYSIQSQESSDNPLVWGKDKA